jgi:hypothetical protein
MTMHTHLILRFGQKSLNLRHLLKRSPVVGFGEGGVVNLFSH